MSPTECHAARLEVDVAQTLNTEHRELNTANRPTPIANPGRLP